MRFSDIVKGTRQDQAVELPRFDGQPDDMPSLKAAVRALNGLEEEAVLSAARKRAESFGVKDPRPGEPLYDLALMCETIVASYVDPESPQAARTPFFDSVDLIRGWYGREAISYLYEIQQRYQDQVAPTLLKLSPVEFAAGMTVLGGESEIEARSFFVRCRPGLQWNFMRTSALQLMSLLTPKPQPGSTSERVGPNGSDEPKS